MIRGWAVALAVWSAIFGAIHVAWALGWRWGVPSDQAPIAERPIFLTYDLVAAAAMLAAAAVAARVAVRPDLLMRRRLRVVMFVATAVAAVRGVVGLTGDMVLLVGGKPPAAVSALADIWFVGSAVVGSLLLRMGRQHL